MDFSVQVAPTQFGQAEEQIPRMNFLFQNVIHGFFTFLFIQSFLLDHFSDLIPHFRKNSVHYLSLGGLGVPVRSAPFESEPTELQLLFILSFQKLPGKVIWVSKSFAINRSESGTTIHEVIWFCWVIIFHAVFSFRIMGSVCGHAHFQTSFSYGSFTPLFIIIPSSSDGNAFAFILCYNWWLLTTLNRTVTRFFWNIDYQHLFEINWWTFIYFQITVRAVFLTS